MQLNYRKKLTLVLYGLLFSLSLTYVLGLWLERHYQQDVMIVNLAGKQRYLSQRILYLSSVSRLEGVVSPELPLLVDEFLEAHQKLKSPDFTPAMSEIYLADKEMPGHQDGPVEEFVKRLTTFRNGNSLDLSPLTPGSHYERVIRSLDLAVDRYESMSQDFRYRMTFYSVGSLFFNLILILYLLRRFIFTEHEKLVEKGVELNRWKNMVQDLMDNSSSLIGVLDGKDRYMIVNRRLEWMTGIPALEWLGRTDVEIRENPKWPGFLNRPSGTRFKLIQGSLGSVEEREYLLNGFPLVDQEGEVYGKAFIAPDVTDWARVTEALGESEILYRKTVENLSDALLILDDQGAIINCNSAAEWIFDYSKDELRSMSLQELLVVDGDNIPFPEDLEFLDEGFVYQMTDRVDPGIRKLELVVSVSETDQAINYIALVRDVTRQREMEMENLSARILLERGARLAETGTWSADLVTGKVVWSSELYRIFHRDPAVYKPEFGASMLDIHPDDREMLESKVQELMEKGSGKISLEHRYLTPDKEVRYIRSEGELIQNDRGKPIQFLGVVRDVTEDVLAKRNMQRLNRNLKMILEHVDANVLTITMNPSGIVTSISQAFCEISGFSQEDVIGLSIRQLEHTDNPAQKLRSLREALIREGYWEGEIHYAGKGEREFWAKTIIRQLVDDQGALVGYLSINTNISNQKQLEVLSETDELTGLNNRRSFNRMYREELHRHFRTGEPFCFVILDVDQFKKYNDTYGHQSGDQVLKEVGRLLHMQLKRSGDAAFRLGGEEFGFFFSPRDHKKGEEFIDLIRKGIEQEGMEHSKNEPYRVVTASFGAIYVDFHGLNSNFPEPEVLYKLADRALYNAKDSGRNCMVMESYDLKQQSNRIH